MLGQRPFFADILATPDDITSEQVDSLGRSSPRWWGKWEARDEDFDQNGNPKQDRQARSWAGHFAKNIQRRRQQARILGFGVEERAAAMKTLRLMLSSEPEQQLTAQELLKCEWMERWAMPDFKKYYYEEYRTGGELS
ncbi:hypothetical protein N7457_002398 [Penicillium paradoxum]|uniref:uncharacterized protein n=1 Tax=Penicillium paradoxum TaxID=176176 RepID=UPI00254998FA|nr:uncharacterized protein N7457_002398 [Penicillium paradoxum]KAJ5787408.1 hypothetical protein N7457_002398 [Penicillium paradoxum]